MFKITKSSFVLGMRCHYLSISATKNETCCDMRTLPFELITSATVVGRICPANRAATFRNNICVQFQFS